MLNTRSVIFLSAIVVGAASNASAQENPIAAKVKASIKNPAKPFTMIVRLQIKNGTTKKFETAFAEARKATRKEKGNLAYDLNRDAKTPTRYLLYERWRNFKSLQAHLDSRHITTLLAALQDILAGDPQVDVLFPVE